MAVLTRWRKLLLLLCFSATVLLGKYANFLLVQLDTSERKTQRHYDVFNASSGRIDLRQDSFNQELAARATKVRSQSTDTLKFILPKGKPVQSSNLWLKLAPKHYINRPGLVFTAEELNSTQFNNAEPLIPRFIHQTWNSYDIPAPAAPYVKSIIEAHPDWEYWFWTDADRRCYMKTHHPDMFDLYSSYPHTIYRTNLLRYFMLYDYGGFYIDLDVQSLQPLDVWTHMASSILTHETYEHTFFAHLRAQPNVMNTVMATRPRHPYYALLQQHLRQYHRTCPQLNLYSNGPFCKR